jgi:hypothetical protein
LAVVLSLFCCLFILGYQYIGRVNRITPAPHIKVEKRAVLPVTPTYNPGDALLDIKMSRDRERSRELERIQGMLDQLGLSAEVKKEAETELWRLNQVTLKETELENLLKANGFVDSLVTVGQRFVTVVVAGRLKTEEAETVGNMAAEVTGFNIEQVRIVEQI